VRLWRKYLLYAMCVLLAVGCATQGGIGLPPMQDWETRQAVLGATTRWEFHGRIGVSAGDEGFNGKLWWWQRDDDFRASISGPFGAGAIRIAGFESRFTMTDKDGEVVEIENAEADLQAMYGWNIPVDSLRYWALGIPDPHIPAVTEFGSDGMLATIEQRNWRVDISQYRDSDGQLMPRRLSAVSNDAKVVLIIDNWSFFQG
jgi:outer membrane lipoprotein LolB